MTMGRMVAMLVGAGLAMSVAPWQEAKGQSGRPLSGPYVPSPTTVPSPVTPPGTQPPVISPPAPASRPTTVDQAPSGGSAQKPLRQPPLPPSPGACRDYPGTISGQPALPPC